MNNEQNMIGLSRSTPRIRHDRINEMPVSLVCHHKAASFQTTMVYGADTYVAEYRCQRRRGRPGPSSRDGIDSQIR